MERGKIGEKRRGREGRPEAITGRKGREGKGAWLDETVKKQLKHKNRSYSITINRNYNET